MPRLLLALLPALASAVALDAPRPKLKVRTVQPVRRSAAAAPQKGGAVAAWHASRRRAITDAVGADAVARLEAPTPARTLAALAAANGAQIALATQAPHVCGEYGWLAIAVTAGAWLSTAQFALLHDVLHGGADFGDAAPSEVRARRDAILRYGSQPSVFGYWLYLARGHLNHHAFTGDVAPRALFASDGENFEDGDLFFALHRQDTPDGADDDPATISIARFAFRTLWRDGARDWNAGFYAASSLLERAALCLNDKYVAVSGSNRAFFPNKPQTFHDACARYARFSAAAQLGAFAAAGLDPRALLYLLVAECAWQLPPWPAAALFVSNHGVHPDDGAGVGGGAPDRPTHSVYGPRWFDALCCNANYHVEHHDFPAVPLWRLPELRAQAGPAFYPDSPPWHAVLDAAFKRPVTYARWERTTDPD